MSAGDSHIMPTYNRADLRFVRGDGAWLETETGEKYLDFGSGVAVNTLGHAHPKLNQALQAQSEKLWHVSNLYRIPEQEKLADSLCAASFAGVFQQFRRRSGGRHDQGDAQISCGSWRS